MILADIKQDEDKPQAFEVRSVDNASKKAERERAFAKVALQSRRDAVRQAAGRLGHKLGAWSGTIAAACKRCGASTIDQTGDIERTCRILP